MKNVRYSSDDVRRWPVLLALAAFSLICTDSKADSANVIADAFQRFQVIQQAPGVQQVTLGSTSPAAAAVNQSATRLYASNSPLYIERAVDLKTPAGTVLRVVATAPIPPAKLARLISGAFKVLPVIGTGIALYELAEHLGFHPFGTGEAQTWKRKDPEACTVGPCFIYTSAPGYGDITSSSIVGWCNGYSDYSGGTIVVSEYFSASCLVHRVSNGQEFTVTPRRSQTTPVADPFTLDATVADFEAAIVAKRVWEETSPIAAATAAAAAVSLLPVEFQDNPPAVKVNGLLKNVLSSVVENITSPPSTKTTTTTENHSYIGDTITTVTNVVTNIYNASTGQNTLSTSPLSGTPSTAPVTSPVTDPCTAEPSRLGCLNAGDPPPAESLPNIAVPFNITPVSFSSAAGCPVPLTFDAFGKSRQISYQPMCDHMYIFKILNVLCATVMAAFILSNAFKV